MNTPKRQHQNENREELTSSQTTIDDLPENLLVQILSSLSTTDAAIRASAIAPPWRNLWHSIRALNFDIEEFYSNRKPLLRSEARKLFVEMLDQALFQRPVNNRIEKFRLCFDYVDCEHIRIFVDSLLMYVIFSKAEELDLEFCECDYNFEFDAEECATLDLLKRYVFHYSVLGNSLVKVLRLSYCNIGRLPGVPLSSKVHSLRELHLAEVYPLTSEQIADLLAICVNLEILSLDNVEFETDWKVESRSLKHFTFQNDFCELFYNLIEICAPRLESLIIKDGYEGIYYLKDTSSLVAAHVEFAGRTWRDFVCWTNIVRSLGGVEQLTTYNMWCKSKFDGEERILPGLNYDANLAKFQPMEEVFSETFVFHSLKHVKLFTGYIEDDIRGLEILLKKCPQLETMALVNIYKASGDLKMVAAMSIVLHMPRLRLVEMKSFRKTEIELFVAGLLKKHGAVLEKIVAYPLKVDGETATSFVL